MRSERENSFFGPWITALAVLSLAAWFFLSQTGWPLWGRWTLGVVGVLVLLPFPTHAFYSIYAQDSLWHTMRPGSTMWAYGCGAFVALVCALIFGTIGLVACVLLSWPLGILGVALIGWMALAHSALFSAHLRDANSSPLPVERSIARPSTPLPAVEITHQGERVGDVDRFSVRTENGFEFDFFIHKLNGSWRISLLRSPDYAHYGRVEVGHPPHRLVDLSGFYVCYSPPIGATREDVKEAALSFAALTDRYISTGISW